MAYATLDELTSMVIGLDHAADDDFMDLCLDAAHQGVDAYCGRHFDAVADPIPSASARVFVPGDELVYIDDISATTSAVVSQDGTTVDSSYYQWEPLNGRGHDGRAVSYYAIRRISGTWGRNGGEATVSVTSSYWGWTATPAAVKKATLLLAKDFVHLRDNRFGVAGFGEYGAVRIRENPHVSMLLAPYRHPRSFGFA